MDVDHSGCGGRGGRGGCGGGPGREIDTCWSGGHANQHRRADGGGGGAMKLLGLVSICVCGWAQSSSPTNVDRPWIGKMLDASGAVRAVYGIAASVTPGETEAVGVLSSGCSKTFCLMKTEAGILSPLGSVDAPAGPALFAFEGDAAYIWFSRSRELAKWHEGALDFVPVATSNLEGEVVSIGVTEGAVLFAVKRLRRDLWIVNLDGSAAGSLARATMAMLIPGGAVYATRDEIVAGNNRLALQGVTGFSWMSEHYLQVRAGGMDYALRIDPGRETLFQLPGVSQ